MMRELEDLLPRVLPYAPGCPDPVAVDHLRDAAIEFCKQTRCWREVDEFGTTDTDIEVVCVPPFSSLFEIEAAKFNGRDLARAPYLRSDPHKTEGGIPSVIAQAQHNSVSIYPRATGKLWISMFLMPDDRADMIPSFIFDQWGRIIAEGALGEILMMPDKPFSNPQLGVSFRGRFQAGMDRNFRASQRGQQRAPARSRPNYF